MDLVVVVALISVTSVVAPNIIEVIKWLLSMLKRHVPGFKHFEYDINELAPIAAGICALGVSSFYMAIFEVRITTANIAWVGCIVFWSIVGSLTGYDKMFSIFYAAVKKFWAAKKEAGTIKED